MSATPPERETFRLDPPGPVGLIGGPARLAGNGGKLRGELVDDRVSIWLQHNDGERVLIIWPGECSARLAPLELLNERGEVVARGGQTIDVVGGFLPDSDSRAGDRHCVFFASRVLRDNPSRPNSTPQTDLLRQWSRLSPLT